MEREKQKEQLEEALVSLHSSVQKLVQVLSDNASVMSNKEEVLNKLPLLDFYNDDLRKSIKAIRGGKS